ncbi:MAG: DEAD/DEAH box helicase family protein [Gammaproteobacteria bacterium]|nr:DEAD/DEAH box helicase family protein [Gammaproteobacteria bacterium]MBU1655156.1 DEAD/DEAH box helicase family protein [Gammaproteobacteria bacterium]MBU1959967.1 DEAD/DEAH box helicase family protein [Gammaproteobacteria bacterium]
MSGDVTKFEANVAAIDLLRKLWAEKRQPNADERTILNRYTGWGGLPQAFNREQRDPSWSARAERLQTLLDGDEWESAHASTPNAHYTSLEIIEAMWAMVERLGFKGGRILEPSAGTGYFLGAMPEAIARNSQITAIELDQISSRILKKLYGDFDVQAVQDGFERRSLPPGYFDLAISNVPFGNYQVPELRNVPYQGFLIHDYFFAKALEVVRPGGLVVFITSSGTMDKNEDRVRQYLGSQADLVAAIRLPNTAFKKIANTSVTTDILILQKPLSGKSAKREWMDVKELDTSSPVYGGGQNYWERPKIYTNQYFAANPQWVIGKLKLCDNGYGKSTGCIFEGDLDAALTDKIGLLPEGIYASIQEDLDSGTVIKLSLTEQHRPGFRLVDGKVYEIHGSEAVLYKAPQKTLDRIAGMVEIRDAARKLVKAQAETEDDRILETYRLSLSLAYDNFQGQQGFLHAKANRQAFRADPDLPLLLSLERWDEATQTAEKADIFHRRTAGAFRRIERCETAQEALLACIVEKGRVVENRIGKLLGKPGEEVMQELEGDGSVFLDPATGRWETADAYLSGNVRDKLTVARLAGQRYHGNAQALEAVIPADLAPHEIGARIGSTWIPASDYEAFLNETLEGDSNRVEFGALAGAWSLEPDWRTRYSVAATQTYGTGRVNAVTLFELALNQMVPTVYDPSPLDRDKRLVNQKETIAAREKQQQLKEGFVEWLWSDDARAQRLARLYNDQFNAVVQRRYDGQHLVLPGFSQVYRLHDHQRDAAWRTVASGVNTLLAHTVGAGKTLTMICAGMELRRLGKASKPLYVVPNHMLAQFAAEFLRAYPGANILMAGKEDLQGDRRRLLLSRIATGDWDGVLMTHASFERIKMSDAHMKEYIKEEIATISDAILAAKQDRGNRIVKELARAKKSWEAKLAKLTGKTKKDDLLTFEELGIDWLFIDEAHLFKNLWKFTKMTRVAGLPNSNSERAFDMFIKTRYVMEKHGGRAGVTFATGTPVSNSMAELWVMQRYLQPRTLENQQVGMFDTWAGNFGESVTALELAPDGRGYRMQTRFAKFVNLPELMSMFGEVADIRTAEMLNLPVPKAHKETVTAPNTPDLKLYVQSLVERAEAIRNGEVTPSEDNMLAVTNDGRKAALDMRLVRGDASHPDLETSKVNLCARKVQGVWQETTKVRGAQIVFCDQSTPHSDGRFSVYQDLRHKLVEMGVPAAEIAFIHDYDSDSAKEELFKSVREGRIRILLGSTGKMGVGTNVQTRLVALHHLDAPWRPSDVEQREGRIIRQGNLNEEVRIYRYVTEGSFDSYIWQTLETKARFIAQVMQGDSGMRSAEDVELAALSYAEVKALASGNPLVLEKAGVDTELAKLSLLKSQWDQQQWRNRQELATLPSRLQRMTGRIAGIEADIAARGDVSGPRFAMEVEGIRYRDRAEAGKAIMRALQGVRTSEERVIGRIAGLQVGVRASILKNGGKQLLLLGDAEYEAGRAETATGMVKVLENALGRMGDALKEERALLERTEKRLADIQTETAKPFEKADRLVWLRQRQREIEGALDLTKGEMAAAEETESEAA